MLLILTWRAHVSHGLKSEQCWTRKKSVCNVKLFFFFFWLRGHLSLHKLIPHLLFLLQHEMISSSSVYGRWIFHQFIYTFYACIRRCKNTQMSFSSTLCVFICKTRTWLKLIVCIFTPSAWIKNVHLFAFHRINLQNCGWRLGLFSIFMFCSYHSNATLCHTVRTHTTATLPGN